MSKFRKVAAVPIKMPKLDLSAAGLAKLFQGNETEDIFVSPQHEYTKELLRAIPQPDPLGRDERKKERLASKKIS